LASLPLELDVLEESDEELLLSEPVDEDAAASLDPLPDAAAGALLALVPERLSVL
jgi:hypothetical protein